MNYYMPSYDWYRFYYHPYSCYYTCPPYPSYPCPPYPPYPCPPAPPVSPAPVLFPVSAGDTTVSGEGSPGCTIVVTLPNGTLIAAAVDAEGLWSAAVPAGVMLLTGETVSAVPYCPDALPGPSVSTVIEAAPAWTVTGLVSPVVYDDFGHGEAFLDLFRITVELRTSLHVPGTLRTIVERNGTATGRFTITNVPAGNYILYIDRPGYLPRTLAVSVAADSPDVIETAPPDGAVFTLTGGDANGDGIINSTDTGLITNALDAAYPTPPYAPNLDIVTDGYVNALDLSRTLSNFNKRSSDYPGAVWD